MLEVVINEYHKIQTEYRQKCRERIRTQLEITGRQTTDEQMDQMIESGQLYDFAQSLLTDTKNAKQSLADIEARHRELLKVEESIRELNQMFKDLAMIVECQGETH